MNTIIGFLTAYWPYILVYPFMGRALGRLKWKLFNDDRPTSKLKNPEKVIRRLFFPFSYSDENWKTRMTTGDLRGLLNNVDEKPYKKILVFFWPFALIPLAVGFISCTLLAMFHLVCFSVVLHEKSYQLLQSGSRRIKKLSPGNNQDIKTVISQIDEFRTIIKLKKEQLNNEFVTIDGHHEKITTEMRIWQVIANKDGCYAGTDIFTHLHLDINLVIKFLAEEDKKIITKKSELQKFLKNLDTADNSLLASRTVLSRCSSTITLGIPITVDGLGLIKQDYLATLAANIISRAETEMAGIKEELEKHNFV